MAAFDTSQMTRAQKRHAKRLYEMMLWARRDRVVDDRERELLWRKARWLGAAYGRKPIFWWEKEK